MNNLKPVINEYIEEIKKIKMGEQSSEFADELLKKRLKENVEFDNKIMIAILSFMAVVILVSLSLAFYYKDPILLGVLFGVDGFSLYFVINKALAISKEKKFTDIVTYMIPRLENSEERIKFMEILRDYVNHNN